MIKMNCKLSVSINKYSYNSLLDDIFDNLKVDFNIGINIITGPNGSGKTTLLNIISGNLLTKKNSKDIKINFNNNEINYKNKNEYFSDFVNYVPQDPLIIDNMSVLDNLLLPFLDKNKQKAIDILKKLGLENQIDNNTSALSGGEKQRLNFARTLYKTKKIILLDEITTYLDKESRDIIFSVLEELSNNHIIILVTHEEVDDSIFKNYSLFKFEDRKLIETKICNVIKENTKIEEANFIKGNIFIRLINIFKEKKLLNIINAIVIFILITLSNVFFTFYFSVGNDKLNDLSFDTYKNSAPAFFLNRMESNDYEENTVFPFEKNDFYIKFQDDDLCLSNKQTSFENFNIGAVYATNEQLEDTLNIELINFNGLDFDFAKTETGKQGFLISDITFNFYFNALKEKYPKYESNEIILMIKNNLKYKVYDNIYELCGVYKSSINEIYKDNFNVIMDNIFMQEALYSYGFMCQNVFIPYDEANANNNFYHIVLNTEYNRNVLQKDINFVMFSNFTLLNNNGTSDFWILYNANSNLYFAITFVVAAIVYLIVVSTGYYNGENKRFLVSRIAGQSRSSQTNKYLLFNSIWVSIFYFISAAISSLIVYICQILITNSTIFSIKNVFIFSPYLILIYVLLIGLSALIYYILYYKLLSPKDISKQLYKIKQK